MGLFLFRINKPLVLYLTHMTSQRSRKRTYARNRAFSRRGREMIYESDGTYFLKLVLVLLLGTLWLKFRAPLVIAGVPFYGIPVGMLFGLLVVSHFEKLQFDRKIWYAILVVATVVSFFLPAGIII